MEELRCFGFCSRLAVDMLASIAPRIIACFADAVREGDVGGVQREALSTAVAPAFSPLIWPLLATQARGHARLSRREYTRDIYIDIPL